jgi:hypothetical protein
MFAIWQSPVAVLINLVVDGTTGTLFVLSGSLSVFDGRC